MKTKLTTDLNFTSVQVRDLERSKTFYSEVLSFEMDDSPNSQAIVFKSGGGAIFAIRTPLVDLNVASKLGWGISLWFGIADIDSFFDEVSAKTEIIRELQETPFGKTFVVADPDGYLLTFQQKKI